MQEGFWQSRWQRDQIGFHRQQVNSLLMKHWPALQVPKGSCVFVPLCGKSLDLCWLAEQGYSVLGVELVEKAVVDFFTEQNLTPAVTQQGVFKRYNSSAITILCGDFFALSADDLAAVDAFYDRAALVALPDDLRRRYGAHLCAQLPKENVGLLMTVNYPQSQMEGPPFAVGPEEVEQLLGRDFTITCSEERDVLSREWRYKDAGITFFNEYVFSVKPRNSA